MSSSVNPIIAQVTEDRSNNPSHSGVPGKFIYTPVVVNVQIGCH
jgi:hypothetical protein